MKTQICADQGFKDSKIQGFKDSRIQGFKDSKIQGFKDSRIQRFKDSRIQRFEALSMVFKAAAAGGCGCCGDGFQALQMGFWQVRQ